MNIKKIELSWITVEDLEKSRHFFSNVLGLEVTVDDTQAQWLELTIAGDKARLGVAQAGGPCTRERSGTNAIITFKVDDITAAIGKLKQKGVHFISQVIIMPGGPAVATFIDADGNKFQLIQD